MEDVQRKKKGFPIHGGKRLPPEKRTVVTIETEGWSVGAVDVLPNLAGG
jgi:hypothetical protein